jgi:hypothetical protein
MDALSRIWFPPLLDNGAYPQAEARDPNMDGVDSTKNVCWSYAREAIFVRRGGCAQVTRTNSLAWQ